MTDAFFEQQLTRKEQPMRLIAGSILVLAASICVLGSANNAVARMHDNATLFLIIAFIPFALGLYFLFSKDKPGT
jgi:heme/copper-type cytochrome/quinol oxidase subunit 3